MKPLLFSKNRLLFKYDRVYIIFRDAFPDYSGDDKFYYRFQEYRKVKK